MQTRQPETPALANDTAADEADLDNAIRDYVRTYALWHGRAKAAWALGEWVLPPVSVWLSPVGTRGRCALRSGHRA